MTAISFFIIAVVLIVALIFAFAKREAGRHGTKTSEEFMGICKSAVETASQKEARKQKITELLRESELSNSEIRKALRVSSRTAVRYLDELEHEGKVEQVGKIGHAVTYRLK